jgi:lipopolysaccharide transport system ATP-binding protein
MSDGAIRVTGLGKQYRIGGVQEPYKTLRGSLTGMAQAPLRRLRRSTPPTRSTFWALKDVSFEVKQGEVLGIIGRNGAGKSTLLKILSSITEPTTGQVEICGQVASLLEVGTGFHPELTGRENIFLNGAILGMRREYIQRRFDEIVAFAEVEQFIDTPVKHYSSGMYLRLAFAVAAHLEPDILVVDEVLAVGDAEFQKKCLGKMGEVAKGGRTVLFVSHNMGAVQDLCAKAIVLDKGQIALAGTVQEAVDAYLDQAPSQEITFTSGAVRRATARQAGAAIVIGVDYEVDRPLRLPNLGFVISDHFGNPICGSNALIDEVSALTVTQRRGHVNVVIDQPLLLNGTYRLSLWFGDGKEDFFHARDCLNIDVANMTKVRQWPASIVGPVSMQCRWSFDTPDV